LDSVRPKDEGMGDNRRKGGVSLHPTLGPDPLHVRSPAGPGGSHPGQSSSSSVPDILPLAG